MPLTDEDVREILRIIDESDVTELRLETEGFSLHVVKGGRDAAASGLPAGPRDGSTSGTGRARGQAEATAPTPAAGQPSRPASAQASPGSSAGLGEPSQPDGLVAITAPMLGTFYRAEAPGKPPFVEAGSRVEPDTIVCIIEVMKMMNSVPAGVSGRILQIFATNAELVEYGQPLFEVERA
jgi:acetyl-CoA carboxylase biotin carboxyl carrier protein